MDGGGMYAKFNFIYHYSIKNNFGKFIHALKNVSFFFHRHNRMQCQESRSQKPANPTKMDSQKPPNLNESRAERNKTKTIANKFTDWNENFAALFFRHWTRIEITNHVVVIARPVVGCEVLATKPNLGSLVRDAVVWICSGFFVFGREKINSEVLARQVSPSKC